MEIKRGLDSKEPPKPSSADELYMPYEAQDPVEGDLDKEDSDKSIKEGEEAEVIQTAFKPSSETTTPVHKNADSFNMKGVSVEKMLEGAHAFTAGLVRQNPVYQKFPVEAIEGKRTALPCARDPNVKINVWTLLKENIGKDLSKIAMPIYLNDPISMLQKVAETLEFAHFLRKANNCPDKNLRLFYVYCFHYAILPYTIMRLKKPFNPMLGETYEYIDKDLRFFAEQVSHHPPISAFYCESDDFIFEGYYNTKSTISMSGFAVTPKGPFKVLLRKTKENYSFSKPKTSLHNFIIGKMYLWHYGDSEVVNENTKDRLQLNFKAKGWTSAHDYECDGKIIGADGKVAYTLVGKWDSFLQMLDLKGAEVARFDKPAMPPNNELYYYFSEFCMNLNHLDPSQLAMLPPTDSRLRPDQRAYEFGDLNLAASEKLRLEENQRTRRKEFEKTGKEWKPTWFYQLSEKNKDPVYQYNGKYFDMREMKIWPKTLQNLFGN